MNARDQFVERVRLQEAIVAPVRPRIPSISALVAGTNIEFVCGNVASLDASRRRVWIASGISECEIAFDQAIYALGSHKQVGRRIIDHLAARQHEREGSAQTIGQRVDLVVRPPRERPIA